jgi:stage II sporulation protein AA (anti-sigma F factor antagonist)
MMMNGVPVVTAPAEIDISNAEQLCTVLRHAAAGGPTTVVVDMTCTRFCDSTGLMALVRAHRRARADGGEVRLVVPAGGTVARLCAITCVDQVIPLFGDLEEALVPRPRP